MKTSRQYLGEWGERLVARQYVQNGFVLLAKNVRYKRIELDLLFEKNGILYSVEVKTRASLLFGNPEDAITDAKRERLYRATAVFALKQRKQYRSVIVQVCAVILSKDRITLRIYTVD